MLCLLFVAVCCVCLMFVVLFCLTLCLRLVSPPNPLFAVVVNFFVCFSTNKILVFSFPQLVCFLLYTNTVVFCYTFSFIVLIHFEFVLLFFVFCSKLTKSLLLALLNFAHFCFLFNFPPRVRLLSNDSLEAISPVFHPKKMAPPSKCSPSLLASLFAAHTEHKPS